MFEFKHSTNSRKSCVSGIPQTPLLDSEEEFHSLFGSHGFPLEYLGSVGLLKTIEDADGFLHNFQFIAPTGCCRMPARHLV